MYEREREITLNVLQTAIKLFVITVTLSHLTCQHRFEGDEASLPGEDSQGLLEALVLGSQHKHTYQEQ